MHMCIAYILAAKGVFFMYLWPVHRCVVWAGRKNIHELERCVFYVTEQCYHELYGQESKGL